jgi:hypothetical protein
MIFKPIYLCPIPYHIACSTKTSFKFPRSPLNLYSHFFKSMVNLETIKCSALQTAENPETSRLSAKGSSGGPGSDCRVSLARLLLFEHFLHIWRWVSSVWGWAPESNRAYALFTARVNVVKSLYIMAWEMLKVALGFHICICSGLRRCICVIDQGGSVYTSPSLAGSSSVPGQHTSSLGSGIVTDSQMRAMEGTNYALTDLNNCLRRFSTNTLLRIRHFISQCSNESGYGNRTKELGSGTEYEGSKSLGNTRP